MALLVRDAEQTDANKSDRLGFTLQSAAVNADLRGSAARSNMKVLISWSGELSHRVALLLREWLPMFIQVAEPWVSSEDIAKGELWRTELAKELEEGSVGI